jgi:hypothetical protein
MIRRILVLIAFLFAAVGPAKASVLYEFEWAPGALGINANWSFVTPSILSVTTTIDASELLTAFTDWSAGTGTITSVIIDSPFGAVPSIRTLQGSASFSDFGFSAVAPFDHFGTYTSIGGSVLKISEYSAVPEPGVLGLLSIAVLAAGLVARRRRR